MLKGTAVVGTPKARDSYRDVPVPESIRPYAVKLRTTENKFVWEMKKEGRSLQSFHLPRALQKGSGSRT